LVLAAVLEVLWLGRRQPVACLALLAAARVHTGAVPAAAAQQSVCQQPARDTWEAGPLLELLAHLQLPSPVHCECMRHNLKTSCQDQCKYAVLPEEGILLQPFDCVASL
jgi:hypothetical protein